jgi:hypothetical protein
VSKIQDLLEYVAYLVVKRGLYLLPHRMVGRLGQVAGYLFLSAGFAASQAGDRQYSSRLAGARRCRSAGYGVGFLWLLWPGHSRSRFDLSVPAGGSAEPL